MHAREFHFTMSDVIGQGDLTQISLVKPKVYHQLKAVPALTHTARARSRSLCCVRLLVASRRQSVTESKANRCNFNLLKCSYNQPSKFPINKYKLF